MREISGAKLSAQFIFAMSEAEVLVGVLIVLIILGAFYAASVHRRKHKLEHNPNSPVMRPGQGGKTNTPLFGRGSNTYAPIASNRSGVAAEGFVGAYGRSPEMQGCISWADGDSHRIPSFNRCSFM